MPKKKIILKKKGLEFIEEEFRLENPKQYGIFLDGTNLVIEGTGKPLKPQVEHLTEDDEDLTPEIIATSRTYPLNPNQFKRVKANIIKR